VPSWQTDSIKVQGVKQSHGWGATTPTLCSSSHPYENDTISTAEPCPRANSHTTHTQHTHKHKRKTQTKPQTQTTFASLLLLHQTPCGVIILVVVGKLQTGTHMRQHWHMKLLPSCRSASSLCLLMLEMQLLSLWCRKERQYCSTEM